MPPDILNAMFDFIGSLNLSAGEWGLLILSAILTGMSKTGLQGATLLIVPALAIVFGGKESSGLLLPMLVIADIFAVYYYRRHAEWKYLFRLAPFTIAGVFLGIYVGDVISDEQFKTLMGAIILASLALMIWREWKKSDDKIPDAWWFSAVVGLAGGFSTMIGNAAGPVMAVYLLSMRLPKNVYIGTGAWFFLLLNIFKVPFHILVWETISFQSFSINLLMAPVILAGAILGVGIIKKIPEKPYRVFVIVMTAAAALRLFF